MAQVKIYASCAHIDANRKQISDLIHQVLVASVGLPEDKRFHRFIPLASENFIYPAGRSAAYTIIEISMFEGRSPEAKKDLLNGLMRGFVEDLAMAAEDVEITIFETPRANWGIRGQIAADLVLDYKVEV